MNWQTLWQFLISTDIIPFVFSLFLALLSPVFSKFVAEEVVRKHLPTGLSASVQDVIDFSTDAVRKVGFISSLYIATINSILVIVKARDLRWGIYPAITLVALTLFTFLKLPRISPFDFQGTFLGVKKFRWLWIVSIVINVGLIYLAFRVFEERSKVAP